MKTSAIDANFRPTSDVGSVSIAIQLRRRTWTRPRGVRLANPESTSPVVAVRRQRIEPRSTVLRTGCVDRIRRRRFPRARRTERAQMAAQDATGVQRGEDAGQSAMTGDEDASDVPLGHLFFGPRSSGSLVSTV